MIKSINRRLLMPVKKMASGGDLDWSDVDSKIQPVGAVGAAPITANAPSTVSPLQISGPTSSPTSSLSGTLANASNAIMPYASNIVNQFQRPPNVPLPHQDSLVTLNSPSFANDRNEVNRDVNTVNASVDRSVDGQTAAKIKLFNLGQKLDKLSAVNQADHNMQLQTNNDAARINAGISARNNEKLDQFNNEQVARKLAIQREQSANLSNASDKFIGIQNENAKRQLDLDKTKTMSTLFSSSGVGDRERTKLKELGVPDPLGKSYEDIKKYGGMMRLGGSFYRGIPIRGQTLKSLYKAPV